MVHVEVLDTPIGKQYRVSRVFPNAASAECACRVLERVNPNGFIPAGEVEIPADVPERDVVAEATVVAEPTTLVVDEDAIPGCPSGVCGLD